MTDEKNENDEALDDLFNAMKAAREGFDKYFEERGVDGAYFQLDMRGYVLDFEFQRWKIIEIRDVE